MSDLPPGWKEAKDPNTGRTYYYNKITKQTKWQKPEADIPPPPTNEEIPGPPPDETPKTVAPKAIQSVKQPEVIKSSPPKNAAVTDQKPPMPKEVKHVDAKAEVKHIDVKAVVNPVQSPPASTNAFVSLKSVKEDKKTHSEEPQKTSLFGEPQKTNVFGPTVKKPSDVKNEQKSEPEPQKVETKTEIKIEQQIEQKPDISPEPPKNL